MQATASGSRPHHEEVSLLGHTLQKNIEICFLERGLPLIKPQITMYRDSRKGVKEGVGGEWEGGSVEGKAKSYNSNAALRTDDRIRSVINIYCCIQNLSKLEQILRLRGDRVGGGECQKRFELLRDYP
jgi:hypothetical protein